jgi:hypothetical protein
MLVITNLDLHITIWNVHYRKIQLRTAERGYCACGQFLGVYGVHKYQTCRFQYNKQHKFPEAGTITIYTFNMWPAFEPRRMVYVLHNSTRLQLYQIQAQAHKMPRVLVVYYYTKNSVGSHSQWRATYWTTKTNSIPDRALELFSSSPLLEQLWGPRRIFSGKVKTVEV